MIVHTNVESSNITSMGYDSFLEVAEIKFNKGTTYRYYGVPSEVYFDLLTADSVGRHFARNFRKLFVYVKDGTHDYVVPKE